MPTLILINSGQITYYIKNKTNNKKKRIESEARKMTDKPHELTPRKFAVTRKKMWFSIKRDYINRLLKFRVVDW